MKEFRFKVFGKIITVAGAPGAWTAYFPGNDGKRRLADFIVPADIQEDDLEAYLADLFHEYATPRNNSVTRI
jgi:hypothetical protein